jgi:ubiquinone/menaquinone biosynthesis C-methylase UbiE
LENKIIKPGSRNSDQKQEIQRLITQAACWEEEAENLFDQIKIGRDWTCADLGCGPMGVLLPLSKQVNEDGLVCGMDFNLEFIQAAKEFIDQNQLKNVGLLVGDLYHPAFKLPAFDLTHERFVFSQIGCDQQLLEIMIKLTRPGGVVISQEADWSTWNCDPSNADWEIIRCALVKTFEQSGGDINAGQRTHGMFTSAGLEDVQMRTKLSALPFGHPYRSGMIQMARSMREKILQANALTANVFDEVIERCDKIIDNASIMISSYILCQVWGRVKKNK